MMLIIKCHVNSCFLKNYIQKHLITTEGPIQKFFKGLLIHVSRFPFLLVAVGDRHPGNRSGVTAQEEERDVAGGGHQVDQHGHADGAQSWQVQLLHQQPPEENTETGTGDGRHPWGEKTRVSSVGQLFPLAFYWVKTKRFAALLGQLRSAYLAADWLKTWSG